MQQAAALTPHFPALSYGYDALEPYIDRETMHIHHDKHHFAYFNNFKLALQTHPELLNIPPEELLHRLESVPEDIRTAVRNHGGGHLHHSIFWTMMKPNGGGPPTGRIAEIIRNFGGFDAFKSRFNDLGAKHFGSGWVWLVRTPNQTFDLVTTPNQDSPYSLGLYPIMCNDVWEHAYYLKYQNRRADYLQAFWSVVNWDEINRRIEFK